ncbi:MAG: hypothetical protein AUJ85_05160 [Elusimicrobia bacterium CG1_02_37_114]|nr:MAG: hypothetical protein AUJ85_05160 [Elusimicrobia bacterium CG1_02_37_114]
MADQNGLRLENPKEVQKSVKELLVTAALKEFWGVVVQQQAWAGLVLKQFCLPSSSYHLLHHIELHYLFHLSRNNLPLQKTNIHLCFQQELSFRLEAVHISGMRRVVL